MALHSPPPVRRAEALHSPPPKRSSEGMQSPPLPLHSLLQERVREAANAALTAAQAEAHARLSAVAAEMGLPTPSAGELPGMGQLPGMDM